MAAYKMAAVKVTPPKYFPLGLIRSHMVVIHLFFMLCDLQRVVKDLCPTLYTDCVNQEYKEEKVRISLSYTKIIPDSFLPNKYSASYTPGA
jgi:hypothetical protein